jgi:hypothetical protein
MQIVQRYFVVAAVFNGVSSVVSPTPPTASRRKVIGALPLNSQDRTGASVFFFEIPRKNLFYFLFLFVGGETVAG